LTKTAIILFNLGGPDSLTAVKPFLFNLFKDPAIIQLPQPLRGLVAWLISSRRDKVAQDIYQKMGGGSPILPNTQAQADTLEKLLNAENNGETVKCFIAMRYWHPLTAATAQQVKAFAPDKIVLLPLYPQFSTTTTGSSFTEWHYAAKKIGLTAPTQAICCYPDDTGFIDSLASSVRAAYAAAQKHGTPRVLFSAHGLPEKIVQAGDPYQWQCERTAAALRVAAGLEAADVVACFQSRVGPLKWIGPATDDEVRRAGRDKVPLVVVPIAFVSEHSETLVELGMEYRHLAAECGVPAYETVPTVSVMPDFIAGLARLVKKVLAGDDICISNAGARICPAKFTGCPL
jgi:ferrochelatase